MKWEYRIEAMRQPSGFTSDENLAIQYVKLLKEHEEILEDCGKSGWEMFHVVGPMFYMKRLDPSQRSGRR